MSILEVSEEALLGNVRVIERVLAEAAGDAPALLAVVKANGYGHSATLCAPILARAGVAWLGVTDAAEGAAVRASLDGAAAEILVMSGPPGDLEGARETAKEAVRHRLTPVVWTLDQMEAIADAAGDEPCPVHVEIDTGMSRQGVAVGSALGELLAGLAREPRVRVDGVMTHLASAECADGLQTMRQVDMFEEAVGRVGTAGLRPKWLHLGNASTIDNDSVAAVARLRGLAASIGARMMVRCGLGLYGLCLPLEGAGVARLRGLIRPVLAWKSTITAVQELSAGTTVGYGATFTAERPMRLALLPVGYADGLRRGFSSSDGGSGGWVMIEGKRAAIVGRVSMNLTTVDVTGFEPAVRAGDAVTLLGDGITAEDHAWLCGTIPYEILCGVRGRHVRC